MSLVCVMEECPSKDWIIFGRLCWFKSSVAKVWRRLWKVKPRSPSPALCRRGLVLAVVDIVVIYRAADAVRED